MAADSATFFMVMATGQLECADIPDCNNAYCKFMLVHGDDWHVLDGVEDGITQITRKSSGPNAQLVWNFPIDVTYKSTNAFGWPQLILSIFEVDALGRDVIKGYGCVHLPTAAGRYVRKVRLFRPLSSSLMQQFTSWIAGMPAEFSDPKFPASGEGREVTRVRSTGTALVQLNIITKDMATFGYSEEAGPADQRNERSGF
ncbi:B9 domain-containing protein [Klebsormidium nitens]|uniref:B9 domain-containing protein 1 n=1 Tax=Klebsormidium nitens TaxID=105231 RepID=A0A1Y1I734_KLENI|nr:B9 domain-containing protein [Klebsormidium nitens]|eukprot:GAQ83918.1 B9 domain-containing protein [Klebsormidium nitens]